MKIPLQSVTADPSTQLRVEKDQKTIEEYAENYRNGVAMAPIDVFGDERFIGDGWQRWEAAKLAGLAEIDATIHEGDLRAARLHAAGANESHGRRRTVRDRKNAVVMVLSDPEWSGRSNAWVAEKCRVYDALVSKIRAEIEDSPNSPEPPDGRFVNYEPDTEVPQTAVAKSATRKGRDGKNYPAKRVGKKPVSEKSEPAPVAPVAVTNGQPDRSKDRAFLRNRPETPVPMSRTELNRAKREETGQSPPRPKATGRLAELEKKCEKALGVAMRSIDDVINALVEINSASLYSEDCFGAYCTDRWKLDWESGASGEANHIRVLEMLIDRKMKPQK